MAADVDALRQRVKGRAPIAPRELRTLWSERLRPFWRLHLDLYQGLARRFLEQGENFLASEVAEEAEEFFGDDVASILTRALALARSGAPRAAQDFLKARQNLLDDAEEAKSLLARTFKDLWKSSGDEDYLRQSFELYHVDFLTAKNDRAFPGVNAASMALFLGRKDDARRIAMEVLALLREKPDTANYWDGVTIAECLLVEGRIDDARAAYAAAAGSGQVPHAHLATTRAQARLLLQRHGEHESAFDDCFPLPGVLAFTGHRIDAPGRATPRFPEALAPEIKEQLRARIAALGAGFGYAAAASGADLLFLEAMQEAGLETFVHLPLPEEEFIAQSVADAPGWLERYRAVVARATEFTAAPQASPLAFDYGNRLLLGAARQHAAQLGSEARLLAVWDGAESGGAGGTADYVRLARETGCEVEIIRLPAPVAPGSAASAAPASEERLLAVLEFALPAETGVAARVAGRLNEAHLVHREMDGEFTRLFYATPSAAARDALDLAPLLRTAIGLHAGPVRRATNAITGQTTFTGAHAGRAKALARLEPGGLVYATRPFAALLGLERGPRVRCEFLGSQVIGTTREAVFQVRG